MERPMPSLRLPTWLAACVVVLTLARTRAK